MIYLDHHAATPVCESARQAMAQASAAAWANPSSVHRAGRASKALVERARGAVAQSIGAQAADVVFTSGGTEACNLALLGLLGSRVADGEVVASDVEHPAIEQALQSLVARGMRLRRLGVRAGRAPSEGELGALLNEHTRLVVTQWANHETGNVLPVEAYARMCATRGVPLAVDASQAYGKLPIDVGSLGVSALVLTSSKIGGPTGAAALWLERCRELTPLLQGGAQERGRRPGTPDVLALVGFGAAAQELPARLGAMSELAGLRDRLEQAAQALGGLVNGAQGPRVSSATNLSFRGWRGEILVAALDLEGLCASSGAACSSGLGAPSPVLTAMYPEETWRAESALRLSLGPGTSAHDIERAIAILGRVLARSPART
ncbi:MAG: cysteine desulfurase family protein [Myxococcales bacterium]